MRPTAVTEVQVAGYEKHRCDAEYNLKLHQTISGMIGEFRRSTLKMYQTFKAKNFVDLNETLHRQAKWAAVDLLQLQEGLASYTTFAVDMLNAEYMMRHISGCNDEELATFLYKISNCKVFHMSSRPLKEAGNKKGVSSKHVGYDIVVKFDNDHTAFKFGTAADMRGY